MNILEQMSKEGKAEGGHVFISHSHEDISAVRELRDELEKAGFEPLCLYLKCMDKCNGNPFMKFEMRSILRREINAREWFVFVNSEHSQESEWVQFERQCVEKCKTKKVIQWDLGEHTAVDHIAEKILHNLRVFISCSHKDDAVARRISRKLLDKDYRVFYDGSLMAGMNWDVSIAEEIKKASQDGCVLVLLSEHAMMSHYVIKEVQYALENRGNVIPVLLGDIELSPTAQFLLGSRQHYRLTQEPSDAEIDRMIEAIGRSILG